MITRGLLVAGIAAVALAVGCAQPPKPKPIAAESSSLSSPGATANPESSGDAPVQPAPRHLDVDRMEASVGTPDVLARKAESYSREMESLLANRPKDATSGGPHAPAANPSEVKWGDPAELRLDGFALSPTAETRKAMPPPAPDQLVRPVIETSPPQANQVALALPSSPSDSINAAANTPAREHDEPTTKPATAPGLRIAGVSGPTSDKLADKLAARVRDYPRDVAGQLEYQLFLLLLDEQVPQLTALASLPSEDREMVTIVLDGLSLFRSTLRSDNNMLLSRKIKPLVDMCDRLRSQADLTIPTVALCHGVEGFGKYEPIEPARFAAGTEHKAIIYCEIANFASNLNDKQMWETRLKQDLVLYTEFGLPVWTDRTENIVDVARVRRHDFFVNKRIVIPANLTMQRYLLKVSIFDTQANRVAEATVPLVITAK